MFSVDAAGPSVVNVPLCILSPEHFPLPSTGGTVNIPGCGAPLQTRLPTVLPQQSYNQAIHYLADNQKQHFADVPGLHEETSKELATTYSTEEISTIMKARDMLLKLYKARMEQR